MAIALLRADFSFFCAGEAKTFLGIDRLCDLSNQFLFEGGFVPLLEIDDRFLDKVQVGTVATSRKWPNVELVQLFEEITDE